MNMEVIEQGPEISMPGFCRSSGTGGTFQSPLASWVGRAGSAPWRSARSSAAARASSSVAIWAIQPIVQRQQVVDERVREEASAPSTGS